LNNHAQIVIPQFADPNTLAGVTLLTIVILSYPSAFEGFDKLMGIKMPQPMRVKARKMLRHIFKILKKTTASNPINVTSSCSFVLRIGPTHANTPFPIGGGACLSSATLSFGAYTTEL
jgi:hypothetical protein